MMLLYFGEPAGGSLVMMSRTRSDVPCAATGPVPTHTKQPRRGIEERARVRFMTTYSVDGQPIGFIAGSTRESLERAVPALALDRAGPPASASQPRRSGGKPPGTPDSPCIRSHASPTLRA